MKTTVRFLVFNRPGTAWQVVEDIRQAKTPRLYAKTAGPRPNRLDASERCVEVRRIVTKFDRACELKALFHKARNNILKYRF